MEFKRFTKKNIAVNAILVATYLLWISFIGGIKSESVILVILWLVTFYAHDKSRRFILGFSTFIIFWIIYDSMRIIPNYEVSAIHIREPYEIEKVLFGFNFNGNLLTPNEYFSIVNNRFLDFLSGFFYINWMPIPLGFGIYLYLKDKYLFLTYSLVFLIANLLGFAIYYIYPAAPPWYVELYGFDLHLGVPGNRAGLIRFDELIGMPVFEGIYNKNANVLAAMPSLHAAYPVIVLYFAAKSKVNYITKMLFTIFILGIWFSAVYSNHHYIIDVIMGALVALVTIFVFEKAANTDVIRSKLMNVCAKI